MARLNRHGLADKRITGEGAAKGWVTRRRRMSDQKMILDHLIDVADSITGELVVGERANEPGKYLIGALRLTGWRDRITLVLKSLGY